MTDAELLAHCRDLYDSGGIAALSFSALKAAGVYYPLYERGIRQKELLTRLGIEADYKKHKATRPLQRRDGRAVARWTWDRIVEEARQVATKQANLPPAAWFQQNGHQTLVQAVYYLGYTWEALRDAVGDFATSTFIESRNGLRWRSHPEASISNFLYTRGIQHRRGDRYPDAYATETGRSYGFYDLHFLTSDGWIDVEVWGENPGGHGEAEYQAKREGKESFNASNPRFLGIEFRDCYDETRLAAILAPYIGTPAPFIFDRPTDRIIHSTHWSNTDELIEHCRTLAAEMPDGKFPTEEWLRKRGKWADRPGPTYNTLSVYIKTWLDGVRNLREILGQPEASTTKWDRASVLSAWHSFWQTHGLTPNQMRGAVRSGAKFDQAALREAGRLVSAIVKYADGANAANSELGITPTVRKKWTRQSILEGYRQILATYGSTPNQIVYDRRAGRAIIPDDDYQFACQLIDATPREFSGMAEVLDLIGFETPSRTRRPRRTKAESAPDHKKP